MGARRIPYDRIPDRRRAGSLPVLLCQRPREAAAGRARQRRRSGSVSLRRAGRGLRMDRTGAMVRTAGRTEHGGPAMARTAGCAPSGGGGSSDALRGGITGPAGHPVFVTRGAGTFSGIHQRTIASFLAATEAQEEWAFKALLDRAKASVWLVSRLPMVRRERRQRPAPVPAICRSAACARRRPRKSTIGSRKRWSLWSMNWVVRERFHATRRNRRKPPPRSRNRS